MVPWNRPPGKTLGQPHVREEPRCHLSGLEVLFRHGPRRLAMTPVIAVDRLDGCHRLIHRGEGEEALPGGKQLAESGVLGDHGLAAGQVAGVALAEPAAAEADVLVLGYRELG